MPRVPPTVGSGDHVTINRVTHRVVTNYSGKRGGKVYINRLRTACRSHRFHDLDHVKTEADVSCLLCLMDHFKDVEEGDDA